MNDDKSNTAAVIIVVALLLVALAALFAIGLFAFLLWASDMYVGRQ